MKRCRITEAFRKAKAESRGAFTAYLTMGCPTPEAGEKAVDDVIAAGADIVEIGVPFSDPFADGGVIRSASYEAIRHGMTLEKSLAAAKRLRERHPDTGFVLFSYYNPIFSFGTGRFADAAADAGIDAVLVVDLPLEERGELLQALSPRGIGYIPLIAPNTPLERVKEIGDGLENSFLYVMTVKGTTGERTSLPEDLAARLEEIRSVSHLPVAAGFGISTKAQAEEISRHADGYIVGSALVKKLMHGEKPCLS